eukprot:995737-Prymnesium_polylepis.1
MTARSLSRCSTSTSSSAVRARAATHSTNMRPFGLLRAMPFDSTARTLRCDRTARPLVASERGSARADALSSTGHHTQLKR